MTFSEKGDIIFGKEAKGLNNKQNFRSHHTTRVRMVNTLTPTCSGSVGAYGFSVCIFSFWRYEAISSNNSKDLAINEEIKASEVRVIGPNNEQVGIMKIDDARTYAYNNGVDLVLIVPNAAPPVCRAVC